MEIVKLQVTGCFFIYVWECDVIVTKPFRLAARSQLSPSRADYDRFPSWIEPGRRIYCSVKVPLLSLCGGTLSAFSVHSKPGFY
ncbi:hypothetical protein NQZ68_010796 [Dissostichus eleginoides]|nr:hypothetical protein NQZ68_010796 [Dissostichus eleginoides]